MAGTRLAESLVLISVAGLAALLVFRFASAQADDESYTPLPDRGVVVLDDGEGSGTISVEPGRPN